MSKDEILLRLREACYRSLIDFDVAITQCREGKAQFHEVEGAVGITSLEFSASQRTCYIMVVAGSIQALKGLNVKIEEFAKSNGCDRVRAVGRRGFEKVYSSISPGYEIVGSIYEKKLGV